MPLRLAGIDLSASSKHRTGIAVVEGRRGAWRVVHLSEEAYSDHDIKELILGFNPAVTAVDAPLTKPSRGGFRDVEAMVLRLGARLLPLTLKPMVMLAERGVRVRELLSPYTIVVETHPSSVLRVAGCSIRVLSGLLGLRNVREPLGRDERDALVAALVAVGFAEGVAVSVGGRDGWFALLRPGICRRGSHA
ncbi:MAG: DUF429 domain-containing protein [Hyperthermus sp.]|nr:MAG: DUF429 domain-containing protein [Hyperthermus sp.]